jgi:hypothetical protein
MALAATALLLALVCRANPILACDHAKLAIVETGTLFSLVQLVVDD